MSIVSQTTITKATGSQREAIIELLQAEKLPVDDLPATLDNFFIAMENDRVVGAIGVEPYGDCGLLRSMVVSPAFRNGNRAAALIQRLESHAFAIGIHNIYLLTETAPLYFERQGYKTINREEVPESIKASSEFSHVCPVSAIVMKKEIK